MRKCPACNQTYTDNSLSFCLNDGAALQAASDEPAPTIFMNQARVTSSTNWTDAQPPVAAWQNAPVSPSSQYPGSLMRIERNQTLPTVSLVLGILSVMLFCCGGIPLGIAALITGYLGLNNANNSQVYGGRGLAIAGMATGGIGLVVGILYILFAVLGSH